MKFLFEMQSRRNGGNNGAHVNNNRDEPIASQLGAGGCSILPDNFKKPKPLFGGPKK